MSALPNHPQLPSEVPQERHLSIKEIAELLDTEYEWTRREFSDLPGVLRIPARQRKPGDKRRKYDKVLVPYSVFLKWLDDHRVKSGVAS